MPGLLIDDMPFSLDPTASSLFFEPASPSSPSYIYSNPPQLAQLLNVPAMDKHQRTSFSLDSPLSGSASDYPLWSPSSSSSSASSSLGRSDLAVQELLLEAAAMVAATKNSAKKSSISSSIAAAAAAAVAAQPESPVAAAATSLSKFLPSNSSDEATWTADDVYSCDEFRMFEFKVRRCMRGRSHDWTECPFAHPGEKARRRDPRRFHYSGAACPDFRKGSCKNGDACELAHGVFECWLHPARYRTQPCKDGRNCKRRVCFFAHTPEQLRLLPSATTTTTTSSSSPCSSVASSPKTTSRCVVDKQQQQQQQIKSSTCSSPSYKSGLGSSPPPLSPPLSPSSSPPPSSTCTGFVARHTLEHSHSYQRRASSSFSSPPSSPAAAAGGYHSAFSSPCASPKAHLSDLVSALHQLELSKAAAVAAAGVSPLWLQQQQQQAAQVQAQAQAQQGYSSGPSPLRPGLMNTRNINSMSSNSSGSSPCTPTKMRWDCGAMWEMDLVDEEEIASPRLDSGRDLRAKIYGRLASSRKVETASFGMNDPIQDEGSPDLNWVNDLLVAE